MKGWVILIFITVLLVAVAFGVQASQSRRQPAHTGSSSLGTSATSSASSSTAQTPSASSGVRGRIVLGPTCPVERVPPDPRCAEKPYATTIVAYAEGGTHVVATTASSASGSFMLSLPPGSYTLAAAGGTTLPRCAQVVVRVPTGAYASTTISCDTGIR